MEKYYLWYRNGVKKTVNEDDAMEKKEEIINHSKTLKTVESVLAYCTQNFVLGPMKKKIADELCKETRI
jgi:hypothetical protein